MVERIMFQFALHSHAIENVTVLYLNWISRGNTRGTGTGTIDRSSTISAPTGREGSDAVTENLKK